MSEWEIRNAHWRRQLNSLVNFGHPGSGRFGSEVAIGRTGGEWLLLAQSGHWAYQGGMAAPDPKRTLTSGVTAVNAERYRRHSTKAV